jgi:hypothetical protein
VVKSAGKSPTIKRLGVWTPEKKVEPTDG